MAAVHPALYTALGFNGLADSIATLANLLDNVISAPVAAAISYMLL